VTSQAGNDNASRESQQIIFAGAQRSKMPYPPNQNTPIPTLNQPRGNQHARLLFLQISTSLHFCPLHRDSSTSTLSTHCPHIVDTFHRVTQFGRISTNDDEEMTIKQSKNDTRKAFRKKLPTAKKKVRESSMKLVRKIGKVLAKRHKKSKARAASTKLSQKIAKVLAERHEMKVRQGVSHRTVTSEAIGVNDKVAWTPKAGWAGAGYTGVPLTEFTCFLKLPLELQRLVQHLFHEHATT